MFLSLSNGIFRAQFGPNLLPTLLFQKIGVVQNFNSQNEKNHLEMLGVTFPHL